MLAATPILCAILATIQVTTSTLGDAYPGTRVRGIDLAGEAGSWGSWLASPGTHRGIDYTYGETASGPSSQYNGRVFDPGTGFHDCGARMYWPQIGRFISADSVMGAPADPRSLNRYSYVLNNPYKYVDPSGKTPLIVAALAVGAAGGVGAAISSYLDQGSVDWGYVRNWTSAGFVIGLTGGLSLAASGGAAATEVAAAAIPTVTVAEASTAGGAVGAAQQLSAQAQRSIQSLQSRLAEHVSKLDAYKANPDAFDNKGFLKNASEAVRNQVVNGRIRHLENEVQNFQKQIDTIQKGGGGG